MSRVKTEQRGPYYKSKYVTNVLPLWIYRFIGLNRRLVLPKGQVFVFDFYLFILPFYMHLIVVY